MLFVSILFFFLFEVNSCKFTIGVTIWVYDAATSLCKRSSL